MRAYQRHSMALALAVASLAALPGAGAAIVRVIPHAVAPRVDVLADGKPFATYLYLTSMSRPALVSLRTPDGTALTRAEDPALSSGGRIGFWFTHGDVNGADFSIDDGSRGAGRIAHRRIVEAVSSDTQGQLNVQTAWTAPAGSVLLAEDTFFTFRESGNTRLIDRVTRLAAINGPVTLGRTARGQTGIQLADGFRPALATRGGGWLAVPGVVDGKSVAIALLEHPANPNFPNSLRCVDGVLEIAPSGEAAIAAAESSTFRYRLMLVDGALDEAAVNAAHRDFIR